MRASAKGEHISGAEQLVATQEEATALLETFAQRAFRHPKGCPDSLHLTIDDVGEPKVVPQLSVVEHHCASPQEADALIASLTGTQAGITQLRTVTGLRGAMLIDASSGTRLDDTGARGVRVSHFGFRAVDGNAAGKAYFPEAIALASKLLAHPAVLAELCISDDPEYTTGYVATGGIYHRIMGIKIAGSDQGTRAIVLKEPRAGQTRQEQVADLIDYMENTAVMVHGTDANAG